LTTFKEPMQLVGEVEQRLKLLGREQARDRGLRPLRRVAWGCERPAGGAPTQGRGRIGLGDLEDR
jgi:hypothetical protein